MDLVTKAWDLLYRDGSGSEARRNYLRLEEIFETFDKREIGVMEWAPSVSRLSIKGVEHYRWQR